jgi:hypothetical protein
MKKIEPPTPGSTWIHTRCQRAVKILRVLPAVLDKRLSYVEYYYPRTSGRGPGGLSSHEVPGTTAAVTCVPNAVHAEAGKASAGYPV